jgi:hypothetical protein
VEFPFEGLFLTLRVCEGRVEGSVLLAGKKKGQGTEPLHGPQLRCRLPEDFLEGVEPRERHREGVQVEGRFKGMKGRLSFQGKKGNPFFQKHYGSFHIHFAPPLSGMMASTPLQGLVHYTMV